MNTTLLPILLALAFVGCATTQHDTDIHAIAFSVFGSDTHLLIHRLPHFSPGLPVSGARDVYDDIRDLWSDMQIGETTNLDLVVTGRSSEYDARMIEHALWVGKAHKLPYLRLLFVGNVKDAERLRPKVEARGAQFYFHSK